MTRDVQLREIEERDLPLLFEHQREPDANRMAAFPARDREGFLEHWTRILADDTVVVRAILFQGELAGNIGSFQRAGHRHVGYWIGRTFWGRGIATEALAQFLRLDVARPLYARVAKHNAGSIRVLQHAGFRLVGEDRAAGAEGMECEELIYALD